MRPRLHIPFWVIQTKSVNKIELSLEVAYIVLYPADPVVPFWSYTIWSQGSHSKTPLTAERRNFSLQRDLAQKLQSPGT